MVHSAPAIVFGTAGISSLDTETAKGMVSVLEKHYVKELDTAYVYVDSEATLKRYGLPKKFTIHTKAPGFRAGRLGKQSVLDGAEKSLKDLGVDSVDIYYLHAPDPTVPIKETLSAIQELYEAGKFKRFGLSNFTAPAVQEVYDIQSAAGGVLPTVFQGNYNAVSRHIETSLFPLLHKLKISFYAYSPIAGGFLVKNPAQLRIGDDEGRFGPKSRTGGMYTTMYGKESLYQALDEWAEIAKDAGISKAALAYRWIAYHSALKKQNGDAIILGASKLGQLEESLEAIEKGPLDEKTVERVDAIWRKVEHEAPLDNYNSFASLHGLGKYIGKDYKRVLKKDRNKL